MQHLFLADVHLGSLPEEISRQLENEIVSTINFCLSKNIHLHVLGDLFDYWMEYPDHKPELGQKLLQAFEKYNREFISATYITGNHDNWTFGYFENLGFDVQPDYKTLTLQDTKVLLHHGDGISDADFNLPRPLFHRILRNKYFIQLYQSILPPEAGLDLMKQFSKMSKEYATLNPHYLNEWSEQFLAKTDFDVVLSGHDHIPRKLVFPTGTYINTGAFFEYKTMVHYNKGRFELVSWNDEESKISPYINSAEST